ncbi:hypothetical protein NKI88_24075 [Mesorhizobium sp. M0317]|uniref:hypothetical protein n=1 Tax=Mesorhizobium sp. M0317 TaxID=2956935 RepID=UPI003334DDCB
MIDPGTIAYSPGLELYWIDLGRPTLLAIRVDREPSIIADEARDVGEDDPGEGHPPSGGVGEGSHTCSRFDRVVAVERRSIMALVLIGLPPMIAPAP